MLLVKKRLGMKSYIEKLNRKLRCRWVTLLREKNVYKYCYKSYWNLILQKDNTEEMSNLYFTARPNPGAGIGHQMANWISGYWFAKQFGLNFAHIPFSSKKWDQFLGFYQGEKKVDELINSGYKIVRLQSFDENNYVEIDRIKKIINSYAGTKTVFLAEQDQFYRDQYGVRESLQEKFYSAPARNNDTLLYDKNAFNIAIHIRRGDIVQNSNSNNPNLAIRFQSNDYFVSALNTALQYLKDKKNIHIYLFSQGKPEDYPEFMGFENLHFCLDMGAQESFLHMVYADALVTSKSSFSYKPALLNKGIKFSPGDFWHGYPDDKDWILLDEKGVILKR